jgi:hypothetical protein
MGQDKLFELLAIQFCRNPLPMLAFHHFQPQKDGDFRGLARPQQKAQKDLSHQRPKDKFKQSEKPATSRCRRHSERPGPMLVYWLRVFPTEETYLQALVIANLLLLPPDPV